MAAFLLDENVSLGLSVELRRLGHEVTSLVEEALISASDRRIMLATAVSSRTLITHNRRDFLLLHEAWRQWNDAWGSAKPHGGILILDQVRSRSAAQLAWAVNVLLGDPAVVLVNSCHDWAVRAGWRQVVSWRQLIQVAR